MKKSYHLDSRDIKRLRHMVRLVEKAVVEIVKLKEFIPPETYPFAPAQTDVIEETHFVEQQLNLFRTDNQNLDQF
jgi:hypothetical protein